MSRKALVLASALVIVIAVGVAALVRGGLVARATMGLGVDGLTNSICTLHLTNVGACTAVIYPIYSIEARSPETNHDWKSAPLPDRLLPGRSSTTPIFLPVLDDRPWRVAIWCEAMRPAWKDTIRNWLIKVHLVERGPTAFIHYSQWVSTNATLGASRAPRAQ